MQKTIDWDVLFSTNKGDVTNFANGILSFKKFKQRVAIPDARREVNKLEKLHTADNRRILARKACRRRSVVVA